MQGILIRVGVVAAIIVGGLFLRQWLSGNAGDLKVGECFDVPAASEDIEDVQHHPCTDPHTGEVFFVGEAGAEDGAAYPITFDLAEEVYTFCDPAFLTYTGKDSNTDPEWTYGFFYPNEEQWADDSRLIICYASRLDEAPTSTSIKQ
jgi:hypothetical protein